MDPRIKEKISDCRRAIAVGETDKFAQFWDKQDRKTRVALLRITGFTHFLADRKWADLSAGERGLIKIRANDLRGWLNKVMEEHLCHG